jgi:indole-3-glycerol phosphate synthase
VTAQPASDFLAEMVAAARERVARGRETAPPERPVAASSGRQAAGTPPRTGPGRLRTALLTAADGGCLGLIAEVKRRSPSKGDIAPGLDAASQALAYEAAGADAVSVLTEPTRFGGSLEDLAAVAAAVRLPVLRKDFIVDACQVREAAAAGAAAVLLIVAALDDAALAELLGESRACGLDALVEVHDRAELQRAVGAGAELIGVNNRDLRSLQVDLSVTEDLAGAVRASAVPADAGSVAPPPAGVLLVSESGIATPADARRVAAAGARAVLVGEALMRCAHERLPDLVAALRAAGWPA